MNRRNFIALSGLAVAETLLPRAQAQPQSTNVVVLDAFWESAIPIKSTARSPLPSYRTHGVVRPAIIALNAPWTIHLPARIDWSSLGASSLSYSISSDDGVLVSSPFISVGKVDTPVYDLGSNYTVPKSFNSIGKRELTLVLSVGPKATSTEIMRAKSTVYSSLATPISPWHPQNAAFETAPWLEAVDLVVGWAQGATTPTQCLEALTRNLYSVAAIRGTGVKTRFSYSGDAAPNYTSWEHYDFPTDTVSVSGFALNSWLTQCLNGTGGRGEDPTSMNCTDCAVKSKLFCRLLFLRVLVLVG
ncbi:MAG TPA: hypothetical protein VFC37_13070 [Terracidiphilus sp.]|nr:hypothetical protein [Terracidiphilus sp.]